MPYGGILGDQENEILQTLALATLLPKFKKIQLNGMQFDKMKTMGLGFASKSRDSNCVNGSGLT